MNRLAILLLIVPSFMMAICEGKTHVKIGDGLFGKTHVRIRNDLGSNIQLTVHCKSKEDDLGVHVLNFGETYEFSFRPSMFFKVTLFYCSFQWADQFHWFDIFNFAEQRDKDCTNCNWSVWDPNGPCFFNSKSKKYDKCYKWKKN